VDPADAISCVEYLAKEGLIDGKRAGIRGGSGCGYCTLQALWMYPDAFKGGVSEYGVRFFLSNFLVAFDLSADCN